MGSNRFGGSEGIRSGIFEDEGEEPASGFTSHVAGKRSETHAQTDALVFGNPVEPRALAAVENQATGLW